MWDTIRKLREILSRRERKYVWALLVMILFVALIESTRVASILPFVAVLANPAIVEENAYLRMAFDWLGFTSTDWFLVFLGFAMFAVLCATLVLSAFLQYASMRFASARGYLLARRLFEGYLARPYEWFLNRNGADLGKSVLSEVTHVIGGGLMPAIQFATQGAVSVALIAMLVIVDPLLAVSVTLLIGGSYTLIYWFSRRYLNRLGTERFAANTARFRVSQEAFAGIKDIKVMGLEPAFARRFDVASVHLRHLDIANNLIGQLPQYAMQALSFALVLLIVLYQMLTQQSFAQALPIVALYALAGQRLLPALQGMYSSATRIKYSRPALDLVHADLLENERYAHIAKSAAAPIGLHSQLTLSDVSYRYPSAARTALDNVSLTIPALTALGLVGQTGAGKTTLIDVVLGLLKPQSGALAVDGKAITDDNRAGWMATVGYVPQHIFLADDTVAANIALGVLPHEVDMAAVERAARIANLDAFVRTELADGYNTIIGERGIRLSGGQRQRVGIARALYRDPDLLVLDEGTSALDGLTERAVMDAIQNLARRKTIILVAHRLSTVRNCDRIILLDHGRVAASGTYDELSQTEERFRAMADAGRP